METLFWRVPSRLTARWILVEVRALPSERTSLQQTTEFTSKTWDFQTHSCGFWKAPFRIRTAWLTSLKRRDRIFWPAWGWDLTASVSRPTDFSAVELPQGSSPISGWARTPRTAYGRSETDRLTS